MPRPCCAQPPAPRSSPLWRPHSRPPTLRWSGVSGCHWGSLQPNMSGLPTTVSPAVVPVLGVMGKMMMVVGALLCHSLPACLPAWLLTWSLFPTLSQRSSRGPLGDQKGSQVKGNCAGAVHICADDDGCAGCGATAVRVGLMFSVCNVLFPRYCMAQ